MADDLGYGDVGCYGSRRNQTPQIDALARDGMRFTDFHSSGTVCSPTRAGLLTGRYQQRSGIPAVITAANHRDVGLPLEEITFAERLKQAGYGTAMFGKWHLGYQRRFNPVHQGFEQFRGYVSGNVDYVSHFDQTGIADWWDGDKLVPEQGYSTELITKHAVEYIEQNREVIPARIQQVGRSEAPEEGFRRVAQVAFLPLTTDLDAVEVLARCAGHTGDIVDDEAQEAPDPTREEARAL